MMKTTTVLPMRSSLLRLVAGAAVLVGASVAGSTAHADVFLFGFSGGSPNTLSVTTTDGVFSLSTGDSEFTAGTNNQGWWSATTGNSDGNDNWFVGETGGELLNDFFTFGVSSVTGSLLSATLEVTRATGSSSGILTYELFDVSTAADVLNLNDGTSAAIFGDLGSGVSYGSFLVDSDSSLSSSDVLSFALNAGALADIDAARTGSGFFSIGGTLTTGAVPEPSSFVLLSLGLAIAGGIGWNKKRKSKVVAA